MPHARAQRSRSPMTCRCACLVNHRHGTAAVRAPAGASLMSPRPDLGPKPRLGYTASLIERAAERRMDAATLVALENDPRARTYVIGGELVVLKKAPEVNDPLFMPAEARAL